MDVRKPAMLRPAPPSSHQGKTDHGHRQNRRFDGFCHPQHPAYEQYQNRSQNRSQNHGQNGRQDRHSQPPSNDQNY